jgi:hypothetical protein
MNLTSREIALIYLNQKYINENTPNYCDLEIKSYTNTLNLDYILTIDWVKIEEINKEDEFSVFKSITFQSDDGNASLTAIDCEYEDMYGQFLILITETEYVVVGVYEGHPFIETKHVIYDNSDGSGPDLFEDIKKIEPKLLASNLIRYYNEFLNDEYH